MSDVTYAGSEGNYWSSTSDGPGGSLRLYFDSVGADVKYDLRCIGNSVRLVRDVE